MIVSVRTPFVGFGFNMPLPGTLIEMPDEIARQMLSQGLVDKYETAIEPVPALEKKRLLESLPADLPRPRKTRGSSRKSVTKP